MSELNQFNTYDRIVGNAPNTPLHPYLHEHRDPLNLFLHLISAPLFAFAVLTLFTGIAVKLPILSILSGVVILGTVVLQAIGHHREYEQTEHHPETSFSLFFFLVEFFYENTVMFWKFVFSADFAASRKRNPNATEFSDALARDEFHGTPMPGLKTKIENPASRPATGGRH